MTIDLYEADELLQLLIEDSRVPSEYSERLKRLKASIDPEGRFNLKALKGSMDLPKEKLAQGDLENDSVANAIDNLEREQPLYVGLRYARERSVEWKRPGDTEGGNAD